MRVSADEHIRRLIESVDLDAWFAETVCEVDLVTEEPVPGFPLMVQFLIGHPAETYVLMDEDGVTVSARIDHDQATPRARRHDRPAGADVIEAEIATVPLAFLAIILQGICRTGEAPDYVTWSEVPMD